ncbi:MFS transporter [Reyranella aquatilis]|uniref:MFS transporter n=1 Tax=Reyranella aquatilis TaxID=2035356 RepID=A0ABS8KYB7_9HYPH|nr:MFS transporter [Reyranella aquatilis]MCC8431055.1 MFS transporter [Reyranella aquatilis]
MERSYGWVIVGAGALMGCVAIGALFSLAVFLQPMSDDTGWSRTGISSAMTLDFLTMGVAAFGWGALSDRFGPRVVVLSGALLLGLGLALASRATSLLEFQLIYGVVVGIAAGAVFAPMIATVTGWFDRHRSLAVSLVSAGMGVAPMTISPFAQWLVSAYDWRTAQMTIAIAAWVLLVPAALLVRRPPEVTAASPGMPAEGGEGMTVGQALRSPQFIVLSLTFFCCCAAHSGPIFHTVSYALACGLPAMTAVTIYSVEGLAGLGGRILFGLLGDRYGARRIVVLGLMVQAVGAGSYYFTRDAGEFYAVAVLFGMAYGGVMPLYAVIAREYFPMRIMGTVFGGAAMISSLGMALGPAAGGWIFDTFHGYGYLYIASFGIGLAAVAVALAFPPVPSQREGAVRPA